MKRSFPGKQSQLTGSREAEIESRDVRVEYSQLTICTHMRMSLLYTVKNKVKKAYLFSTAYS